MEAGAGNGRLSADILRAAKAHHPGFYDAIRLHLVEASAEARQAQAATLGDVAERLASSGGSLPDSFEGVLIANELLDALPVHQVVMREDGLREVYVTANDERRTTNRGELETIEATPSTPALAEYLDRLGVVARAGLARGNQLARGGLDPRRRAPAAARLHHPDRLRARCARAVLGDALHRHLDDVREAPQRRPRRIAGPRRPGCSSPASRTSPRTSTSPACAAPPRLKA